MKASLKFREERKPLLRAKVPLSIVGLPFQSGIVAGESKDLSLNLATFFPSGPSIKIAYRPNDSWNPFSLVIKTGTGHLGSPISSSMIMSAEFNLVGRDGSGGHQPVFMLHFRPRLGDFSLKKSQSSNFDHKVMNSCSRNDVSDEDSSIELVESPAVKIRDYGKLPVLSTDSPVGTLITGLFSGMEVAARTSLPVRGRAAVNFSWGVRIPADLKRTGEENSTVRISLQRVPFLVMNKIAIEHVDDSDPKKAMGPILAGKAEVGEDCFSMKRQLMLLQAENGLLRRAVEDIRVEIVGYGSKSRPIPNSDSGKDGKKRSASVSVESKTDKPNGEKKWKELNEFPGKSAAGNPNGELKNTMNG